MRAATAIALAAAALTSAGCSTVNHQTARLEAVQTLQTPNVDSNVSLAAGRHAASWGDRWTAANLYEKAVDRRNSVRARFNLAAAYERTGRLAEAAALYRTVARDGQFLWGVSGVDNRRPDRRLTRFNLADESVRRLERLSNLTTFARNGSAGAISAAELGSPASATVGASARSGARISDAEALARDAAANPLG